ncbi:MAG: RNA polymerase factor sigma-54 [Eubacteriales bacterium]|nr:RNA polymerase factor sigma-54 [Eubacteriales bacterium]
MLEQNISQNQQQILSLDQRQSLQILAFTNQELESFLSEEYMQNPMLECDQSRQSEIHDSLDGHYEYASSYKDHYIKYEEEDSDRRGDIRAREPSSLESQLKGQLSACGYSEEEWKLIDYLIACLDEKGFFTYSEEEISSSFGCPVEMVQKCLADLRELEPAGIFSRDLSECLLRQLRARKEKDEILIRIVSDYLPDLMRGNLSVITRALGISTAKCRACIRKIGELNPRPIMNTESDNIEYVVPDILITREDNTWRVTLNDGWMGEYKYNDYYIHMMQTASDPELREYFRARLDRARLIVASIERRRSTLIRITEAILDYQNNYFLRGGNLVPMTMDSVAQKLGISTSTVSRAVKNKYLQYRRPILMRDLFSNAASEKTDVSADHVRRRIGELVRGEDPARPLSDDRIAKLLKDEGMHISRRTVAKYRLQTGIPDSRLRARL